MVRPDAVISGLVKDAGDTLVTLAYAHKWFEKDTNAIVIPAKVQIQEDIAFKAGNFSRAASQWRCLENAWDRSRLYKTRFLIREQEFPDKGSGMHLCKVLEVSSVENVELMDRIAQLRLEQVFFQSQIYLDRAELSKTTPSVSGDAIPLAKAGYLSLVERVAVDILDAYFHLPIDDDSVVIGELPLKAWVRGYAHYERLAHNAAGDPIFSYLRLSEADLLNGLMKSGLLLEQATAFVRLSTFSRGVADLFDAPLLKVEDGSYLFFAPAFHAPVLGVLVLSRISWLNRRRDEQGVPANDSIFENKGKFFEKRVVQLFTEAGIPARSFKYKVASTEYDCDAAVLIEDALFVFECKNRSLPMGHLPSIHYFILALDEGRRQVKRIVQQFTADPELVRAKFGVNATWNRIVPIVLHALPWSFGCSDGVYVYDWSALSHLVSKGFTR